MPLQLYHRTCPICSQDTPYQLWTDANFSEEKLNEFSFASRKIPEGTHFRMLRCLHCDILYTSPAPSAEWLQTAYQGTHYNSAEEAAYAACTYRKLVSLFRSSLPDQESALDIGAGDGAFLDQLLQMGFKTVQGIEPSQAPIQAAQNHIKPYIKNTVFKPEDFTENSFSLITCLQTIEHVPDPLALCTNTFTLLKPGGALCLVAHNYRALSAKLLRTKSPIYDIEHLQLNSARSLQQLLQNAGYNKIRILPLVNTYPLQYWLKLLPCHLNIKMKIIKLCTTIGLDQLSISLRAGNLAAIGFKP